MDPGACLIRPAEPADVEALPPLLSMLFAREPDFLFEARRARAGLEALLAQPRAVVLVVEAGGTLAGLATMQELISTAEGRPVGLVEDVVLAPALRGHGVGRKLVQSLLDIARQRGYPRVQLLMDEDNGAAGRSMPASAGKRHGFARSASGPWTWTCEPRRAEAW